MFLKNCWYVAAWNYEIDDGFLTRTILDEPVLLFRSDAGQPVALEDRCCHRHLPLSEGRLVGDTVQCGYHGLTFDFDGKCVSVPGQAAIPPNAQVTSYPVVERYRWVWIWIGEPSLADEALIPDYHWNDDPEWVAYGDVYHVEGDYRLLIDNLLDLSHIQFLHASTLGAGTDVDATITVERGDNSVMVSRWVLDTPPAPLYAEALGTNGHVDRWQNISFIPPSYVVIDAGSAIAGTGAPEGDRSRGVETYSNHTLTPETDQSTHYFWHHARNFRMDDAALTDRMREMFSSALREDVVAIGAQQRAMNQMPGAPGIDINSDNSSIQTRRLLQAKIEAEASPI
jgi:phenylpropionate dioxygenase-like ring-hydroxylating dioxygenase large terminal subunit